MRESFGARLRQRREQQEIALTTIAEQTKIKASLLEELERDDISHWPLGIFRRAFVRSYAVAIGLDPDVVVHEFLELYPDPTEVVPVVPLDAGDAASSTAGPPTRLRYLVGSALGSLSRFRSTPVPSSPSVADDVPALHSEPPRPGAALAMTFDARPTFEPDLAAAAQLCTELGQLDKSAEAAPLLRRAARVLDAVGLIVWVWDPQKTELTASLSHGYPEKVLAQLPPVKRDSDNATAAAFRSTQTCVVGGSEGGHGAVVVPLMAPTGCVGVLAVELRRLDEQPTALRSVITIFAAQLARWIGVERSSETAGRRLA
jgi:transcriptional regulator with XRE-family HTH domain